MVFIDHHRALYLAYSDACPLWSIPIHGYFGSQWHPAMGSLAVAYYSDEIPARFNVSSSCTNQEGAFVYNVADCLLGTAVDRQRD